MEIVALAPHKGISVEKYLVCEEINLHENGDHTGIMTYYFMLENYITLSEN